MRSLAIVLALGVLAGCRGESQARAEAAALRRQIRGFRQLLEDDDKGRLFPPDQLAIGVRQELVRDLLQRRLPLETTPLPALRVRLETAEITFEGGQSLVTLQGRVRALGVHDSYADLTFSGGLHAFEVDTAGGVLRARVELDRVDVRHVEGGPVERGLLESVNQTLRGRGLGAIGDVLPPVEMPIRLDQAADFPGISAGLLSVPARTLPMSVKVARVVPVAERLWIFLEVRTRP
jgi:hypothetical protein